MLCRCSAACALPLPERACSAAAEPAHARRCRTTPALPLPLPNCRCGACCAVPQPRVAWDRGSRRVLVAGGARAGSEKAESRGGPRLVVQLESQGHGPRPLPGDQGDRDLDRTGPWLAETDPEHRHRPGTLMTPLPGPARTSHVSDSPSAGETLRDDLGGLRGHRQPPQVSRRPMPVEHLDADLHEPLHGQPGVPGSPGHHHRRRRSRAAPACLTGRAVAPLPAARPSPARFTARAAPARAGPAHTGPGRASFACGTPARRSGSVPGENPAPGRRPTVASAAIAGIQPVVRVRLAVASRPGVGPGRPGRPGVGPGRPGGTQPTGRIRPASTTHLTGRWRLRPVEGQLLCRRPELRRQLVVERGFIPRDGAQANRRAGPGRRDVGRRPHLDHRSLRLPPFACDCLSLLASTSDRQRRAGYPGRGAKAALRDQSGSRSDIGFSRTQTAVSAYFPWMYSSSLARSTRH